MLTNSISDFTLQLWQQRSPKTSQSGWLSANAVCCHHRGERSDTKGRGGLMVSSDGLVNYHCFNCGYKASYRPGRSLSHRFRELLRWMGIDSREENRLVIEAMRLRDLLGAQEPLKQEELEIDFPSRSLPKNSQSFLKLADSPPNNHLFHEAICYIASRGLDPLEYEFYWSDIEEYKYSRRVIVPFYWQNKIVGHTARTFVDGIKPKYHSDQPSNFVFNIPKQKLKSKFVIVCEGPFDAMAVDGVALLTNDCSAQQADIIESLNREVIVVPDWDKAGTTLINRAIENGWTVSFPVWREHCKDIAEAVQRFGKLFTLKSILEGREHNPLKIKLLRKY